MIHVADGALIQAGGLGESQDTPALGLAIGADALYGLVNEHRRNYVAVYREMSMVNSQYVAFADFREPPYHPPMDDIERCRENMTLAMQKAGLNPNRWAKLAGVSESGVRGFLSGDSPNISLKYLSRLAEVVGRRPADFLGREVVESEDCADEAPASDPPPVSSTVDAAVYDEAVKMVRRVLSSIGDIGRDEESKAVAHVYHQLMSAKDRH